MHYSRTAQTLPWDCTAHKLPKHCLWTAHALRKDYPNTTCGLHHPETTQIQPRDCPCTSPAPHKHYVGTARALSRD